MRDGWQQTTLGEVATQYVDGFSVLPNETYTNLGVQWYAGGTFAREPKLGSEMKATRLFRVKPGQFIYNRMFVTEGSFALVAAEHADGVVSNEFPSSTSMKRRSCRRTSSPTSSSHRCGEEWPTKQPAQRRAGAGGRSRSSSRTRFRYLRSTSSAGSWT